MKQSQKQILSVLAAAALTFGAVPQNASVSLMRPVLTVSADDAQTAA